MAARNAAGSEDRGSPVLVVMGVAGSGKSTIGRLLAERLDWTFQEGDNLHPPANIDKMRAGIPLTDEDRWPWLDRVASWIDARLQTGEGGVIACSALRRSYRDRIASQGGVVFVHLVADPAELEDRVHGRVGHYMPPSLLASQVEMLEAPGPDEPVLRVAASAPTDVVVDTVVGQLSTHRAPRHDA